MAVVPGFHEWAAEGYSAVRCLHCHVIRDGWLYYSPRGEPLESAPLCLGKPNVDELIAMADNDDAWRAEGEKI